jgi:hypothetical protein
MFYEIFHYIYKLPQIFESKPKKIQHNYDITFNCISLSITIYDVHFGPTHLGFTAMWGFSVCYGSRGLGMCHGFLVFGTHHGFWGFRATLLNPKKRF